MNYVPLFGRWATLSFVAAIATGAIAVSFSLNGKLSSERANSPGTADRAVAIKNPWTVEETAPLSASTAGQIIIVNPDGSIRNNVAGALKNVEVAEGSPSKTNGDDFGRDDANSDGATHSALSTRRIE